jgi:hypothetical protein
MGCCSVLRRNVIPTKVGIQTPYLVSSTGQALRKRELLKRNWISVCTGNLDSRLHGNDDRGNYEKAKTRFL